MLRQKMLQDMRENKWQFISIFLMAFLGVYLFCGIGGEWAGVEKYRESYYEETNLADGWIWGEGFTDSDVEKIASIDSVKDIQKRCYVEVTGNDSANPLIYFYALDENTVSKPLVTEGEDFNPASEGKVWLDKNFASAKGLKVGDTYSFDFEGTDFSLEIAGLVYSSEYQYYSNENDLWPDYNNIGFAFCSTKSLPLKQYIIDYISKSDKSVSELVDEFAAENDEISKNSAALKKLSKSFILKSLEKADESEFYDMVPYTQIIFTSSCDASTLSDKIDSLLKDNYAVYTTRKETSTIEMLNSEMTQHKMMGAIFPIAFMAIAILAIITSMNRLINNQRTQIGTLKALGFGKGRIVWHYVNYGLWVSLFGAVAGLVAGPLTLPYLFYSSMSSYYTLPVWKPGFDISFVYVAAAVVAACTLATFFSVIGLLGDSPAASLRPKAPKNYRASRFEKTKLWNKLGFNLKWSLRSFKRGKVRTVMGIVGTVSCMALLVAGFSMSDCMSDMETWMYDEIQVQQTRLTLDKEATIEDAEKIQADVDGELIMTDAVEIKANSQKSTQNITILDGEGCYYLTDSNRNQVVPDDNTVAMSKKVADKLSLKEGDEFEWHIYTSDKWVKCKVTLINRIPMSQGITMTRKTFESLGYEFKPTYVDTQKKLTTYSSDKITNVITSSAMHNFWDNYMQTMNMMVAIIIALAVLLAVIVLYNLGLLTYTENERQNATLKVLGFPTSKILKLNIIQNLIFSVIGVIFGVPCGLWLVYEIIQTAGSEFDMMVSLSFKSFVLAAVITIGVSLLTSFLFTKKVNELDMVTSLKGVE